MKSGSFNAPDHEYPSTLTLSVTVTDSGGLTDAEQVTLNPETVDLTLASNPAAANLVLNGRRRRRPPSLGPSSAARRTRSAPSPQLLGGQSFLFGTWSDGGAQTHNVVVDQSKTVTATYNDTTPPAVPQITDTDPDSPANDNNPEVKGTAEAALDRYDLSRTRAAAGAPPPPARRPRSRAGITGRRSAATPTTQLAATATDAAGNTSACSSSFPYTEDSTAPAAPRPDRHRPRLPRQRQQPRGQGRGRGRATWSASSANADCTGHRPPPARPPSFASPGSGHGSQRLDHQIARHRHRRRRKHLRLLLAHRLHRGLDRTRSSHADRHRPRLPRQRQQPRGEGNAPEGAPPRSVLHGASCTGTRPPPARAASSHARVKASVPGDAMTQLRASHGRRRQRLRLLSAIAYTEDSTSPPLSDLTDTDPDSPANDNTPR